LFPPFIPDGVDDVVALLRHCVVFNLITCFPGPIRMKEKEPPDGFF
jgi:hypothetical protein